MSLHVSFWGFGKRENSTVYPTTTPLKTYDDLQLKGDCSIVNPALRINEPVTLNVHAWNYCYIAEFRRYYYVSDWIWNSGIWIAELQVDVLASFKTEIGYLSFYILRSFQDSSGYALYDGNIPDTTYPCTAAAPTYINSSVTNPFAGMYGTDSATYIVGIINKSASGAQYYAFDWLGFRQFCTALFNYSTGWLNIDPTEISEDLQKALINPFQYVISAFFLPIDFDWFYNNSIGTYTHTIEFGWWSITTGAGGRILPSGVLYQFTNSLSIPRHPQAASRGNYLNLNPYSIYTLRYYPFGTFDIDSEAISGWNTLDLYTDVDICTGKALLTMSVSGKNNPIRSVEANIAVPIPTAAINVDYLSMGKSTLIAAGAAAVGELGSGSSGSWLQNVSNNAKGFIDNVRTGNWNAIGSNLKESITNIASAAVASKATAEITGQQGSYTLFDTQQLTLAGRFLPIATDDSEHRGRPLCQTRMINTMQGFIMCADADVYIACTDREKSAIKAYLEGGFYYYE